MLFFMTGYGFMSTVSAGLPTLKGSCRDSAEKNLIRRSEARATIGRGGEGSRPSRAPRAAEPSGHPSVREHRRGQGVAPRGGSDIEYARLHNAVG
jgi:hypothetical protein